MSEVVKNLDQLLAPFVGENKRIKDVKVAKLPPAGIGGVMLKLTVVLTSKAGNENEELFLVAKKLPMTEFSRKMFKIEFSVLSEIGFYQSVLPTMIEFQKKYGFNTIEKSSPKFYGARLNLDGTNNLTDDYVLLLEDLGVSGFKNINRQQGFDLNNAKIILKDLAELHATSLAIKLQKPEMFNEKIKSTCFGLYPWGDVETMIRPVLNLIGKIIEEDEEIASLRNKACDNQPRKLPGNRENFATITHCDLWVNNTMQKFDLNNEKIVQNKFVDWAVCAYRSCVSDAIFFIWTSVNVKVIKAHLDELLHYYYKQFIGYLEIFKCDLIGYTYDDFLREIMLESSYEIGHILFFIYLNKNDFILSENDIDVMNNESKMLKFVLENENLKETVWHFIKTCHSRGWLY